MVTDKRTTWLGEVADGWNVTTINSLYSLRNEKVSDKDYAPLSVTMKGIVPQLDSAAKSNDGDNRKLVKVGDFAINSRSDRRGSCGISAYDGSVSLINTVLMPHKAMHPQYYNWLFHTSAFADEFYKWGHGIVDDLWTTRWQEMKRIVVPVPPIDEQLAIAAYLDEQCSIIDEAIADAKASIQEYKKLIAAVIYEAITKGVEGTTPLKDSSIPWIGMIPCSWDTCAIKHCTSKIGSGKTPFGGAEVYSDSGVVFLRSQNIYNDGLMLNEVSYISEKIDLEMQNTRVCYRDVLLNITGGSIGRCCIYDLPNTKANVNQHVCILRTISDRLLPEFLRYFWNSACGPIVVEQFQTGGNRAGLNSEQIGNIKIPFCNIETQHRIVEYLDMRCTYINEIIAVKRSLIEELEVYKRSLIYEAVTGKRKVVQ